MNLPPEAERTRKELLDICGSLAAIVARKNHDYDESFGDLLEEVGPAYFVGRVGDKYRRLLALLVKGKRPLVDEAVEDTVADLAGYCLLYLRFIGRKKHKEASAGKGGGRENGS